MVAITAMVMFAAAVCLSVAAILVVSPKLEQLPAALRASANRVENYALAAVSFAVLLGAIAGWMVG